jgi:hypothetical protein
MVRNMMKNAQIKSEIWMKKGSRKRRHSRKIRVPVEKLQTLS